MLRHLLKSKIHRAVITGADVEYEGSIEIDPVLMEAVNIVDGERILVASITSGNRLETYVQTGKRGSGEILINGGAAHRIKQGELVALMTFGLSEEEIVPRKVLVNEKNEIIRKNYED